MCQIFKFFIYINIKFLEFNFGESFIIILILELKNFIKENLVIQGSRI